MTKKEAMILITKKYIQVSEALNQQKKLLDENDNKNL